MHQDKKNERQDTHQDAKLQGVMGIAYFLFVFVFDEHVPLL